MLKEKRQIPGDAIKNEQTLEELLNNLMNFPGWHRERSTEWIDMVALGENLIAQIPHFQTTDEDLFIIEITGSHGLADRPPVLAQLVRRVREINRQSVERIGRPLLLLLFS